MSSLIVWGYLNVSYLENVMIMQKRTLSLSFLAAAIAGVAILASDPVRADWPQFLGPSRNGHSDGVKLASSWPPTGPKKLWEVKVGMAFSAPVVVGDSVIVLYRQGDEARFAV